MFPSHAAIRAWVTHRTLSVERRPEGGLCAATGRGRASSLEARSTYRCLLSRKSRGRSRLASFAHPLGEWYLRVGTVDPAMSSLEFASVPPNGTTNAILGCRVPGVASSSTVNVALVFLLAGGWWAKPFWSTLLFQVQPFGALSWPTTACGTDHLATRLAA
jgi:hypothetical protein